MFGSHLVCPCTSASTSSIVASPRANEWRIEQHLLDLFEQLRIGHAGFGKPVFGMRFFGPRFLFGVAESLRALQWPRRIPLQKWRNLIKRVWEVKPLLRPTCNHEMRIVLLFNDAQIIERGQLVIDPMVEGPASEVDCDKPLNTAPFHLIHETPLRTGRVWHVTRDTRKASSD
ncbi:MAG: hypothetical protein EXS00_02085 [Phycisphaerales bacterium]|nr:hypothetical protein [Phycisphaerales bacterium]